MGEEVAVVLEPPRPKSPPRYPDLCGRRRLQLELQILNREIDFLKVSFAGRETRAADRGSAVNPRRDRLALFGRAAVVPLWPCGSVPRERSGEAWAAPQRGSATALAVSVLRVEQRVGVSPLASPPVLASRTRTRHGSSLVRHTIVRGNEGLFDAVLRFQRTDLRCWFWWLKTSYNHLKEFHKFLEAVKNQARSGAAGWTTAPVVTRVANLFAHPVVRAAARAATASPMLQMPVVVLQGGALVLQVPIFVLRGGRRQQQLLEVVLQYPKAVVLRLLVRVRLVVQKVYRRVSMLWVP
nr:unnamed protein product [Digitaria exilis]